MAVNISTNVKLDEHPRCLKGRLCIFDRVLEDHLGPCEGGHK
jgi:hypothetical protein